MAAPIELAEAILGSLMVSVGLVAISLALVRRPTRDAAALWFGVFATLYGVRLFTDSELVQVLVPVPPEFWEYRDAMITYVILVPAVRFAAALGGPAVPEWLRWTRRLLEAYAGAGVISDLVTRRPESLIWLNPTAVTLLALITTFHLFALAKRGGWSHEIRVVVYSSLLFGLIALYESYEGGTFGRWELEPFAMLAFIGALGYVVTRRGLQAERHVVLMTRELELAREIQTSILPRELPRLSGLRIGARYLPMREVAGDFYDIVSTASGGVGVLVADVTGHGVPAALIASMVKIAFAAEADHIDEPGRVLQEMNRTLWGKFDRAFVTAFCGVFDPTTGHLRYASAGHPPALVRRRDGRLEPLEERGMMLAVMPASAYPTGDVLLSAGDRVLIVTDGVLEAANPAGEFFGDAELARVLNDGLGEDTEAAADRLVAHVRRWADGSGQLQDDATLLVVDVTPHQQVV
jgi:sigma-B regulation protein RsbU (phosphoserine phosphatase)